MDSSAGLTCDFHSRCPFISIGGEKRRETPEITPETVITVCNPANVFLNADDCQLVYGRSIISAEPLPWYSRFWMLTMMVSTNLGIGRSRKGEKNKRALRQPSGPKEGVGSSARI